MKCHRGRGLVRMKSVGVDRTVENTGGRPLRSHEALNAQRIALGSLTLSLRNPSPGLYVKPSNRFCTVWDSGVSSTWESWGFSPVNSASKLATSSTDSYGNIRQRPVTYGYMQALRTERIRTTLGLKGGWIFFWKSLLESEVRCVGRLMKYVDNLPSPVNVLGEERMPLDLFCATRTKPSRRIPLEQSRHHALRIM